MARGFPLMPSTFEGMSGVHSLASYVTVQKDQVAGQVEISSKVDHPGFLTHCASDFSRGIVVRRRDAPLQISPVQDHKLWAEFNLLLAVLGTCKLARDRFVTCLVARCAGTPL